MCSAKCQWAAQKSPRGTCKHWTEDQMDLAMDAVIEGSSTVQCAAVEYGVPHSTLGDRTSDCLIPGTKSGPQNILAAEKINWYSFCWIVHQLDTPVDAKKSLVWYSNYAVSMVWIEL